MTGSLLATLWGLARTRYLEAVRQPVFGVALAAGLALVALSPALAIFSLGSAEGLVLDLGASALLFFCVLLSALSLAAGSAERLSDGTTALLLTHPVAPATALLAELLGGGLALAQAAFLLTWALAFAQRNGADHLHWGVLWGALPASLLALAWGIRASLRERSFFSAAIGAATLLLPLGWLVSSFLSERAEWGARAELPRLVGEAGLLGWQAALAFAGAGLLLGTRLGPGASAGGTLLLFVLGSLVRGPLGPDALGPLGHLGLLLPDLQLYWIGDAGYTGRPVPSDYLALVTLTTALYLCFALGLGTASLARRELGT